MRGTCPSFLYSSVSLLFQTLLIPSYCWLCPLCPEGSFSLCLDWHIWVSPRLWKSFPMFPQSPSDEFIFFLIVHNFLLFSFMENNYSDCGFAPTHHLISSFSYRFHFYDQCKAMAFDYMKHPNCSSTHAVLSVSLWGKHVCFAFSTYFLFFLIYF